MRREISEGMKVKTLKAGGDSLQARHSSQMLPCLCQAEKVKLTVNKVVLDKVALARE